MRLPNLRRLLGDRRRARRARVRRSVEVLAGVTLEGEGRESVLFTHTLDISETGMSLLVQRSALDRFSIGEGREIKIALALPEGRITVLAISVHVRPCEERGYVVGLRITEAGEEEYARLRDFLRGLR